MTPEQEVVHDIQAEIAKQHPDVQHRVNLMANNLRTTIRMHAGEGHLALVLVAAELAAEEL